MHWIIPALVAPFINASVNFVDKYLISARVKNHWAMPVYSAIVNFLLGTAVWIFYGFPLLGTRDSIFALASGFLLALATAIYFFLLFREDTSKIVFLFALTPVLVLAMASFLFGQEITPVQYLGFFLVMAAVLSVSWNKAADGVMPILAIALAMLMDLLMACSTILIDQAIGASSFLKVLNYQGWGMGLGGLVIYLLIPKIRQAVRDNMKAVRGRVFGLVFINESFTVFYEWIYFFAYSIGPVALVSVVGGTQAFYGILLGALLTMVFPNIFSENVSRAGLAKKIAAAFVLVVGLYLIYI